MFSGDETQNTTAFSRVFFLLLNYYCSFNDNSFHFFSDGDGRGGGGGGYLPSMRGGRGQLVVVQTDHPQITHGNSWRISLNQSASQHPIRIRETLIRCSDHLTGERES